MNQNRQAKKYAKRKANKQKKKENEGSQDDTNSSVDLQTSQIDDVNVQGEVTSAPKDTKWDVENDFSPTLNSVSLKECNENTNDVVTQSVDEVYQTTDYKTSSMNDNWGSWGGNRSVGGDYQKQETRFNRDSETRFNRDSTYKKPFHERKEYGRSSGGSHRRSNEQYREKHTNWDNDKPNNRRNSSRSRDREYDTWQSKCRGTVIDEGSNVTEVFGDLFAEPKEYALAHCVAEDMNMGSGIAVQFRTIFKNVDELLQQRVKQGGVAILNINDRYIYYLVTKRYSSGKPTYETLFRSLIKMRDHVKENNVKKLALPRIGCGLDGLEWSDVKSMLQYLFKDVDVEIKVLNFQQESQPSSTPQPKRKCRVVNVLKPITKIETWTIIIYPCSKDKTITPEIEELDKVHNILGDFRKAPMQLGSVIRTERKEYIIYGIMVKENVNDSINFKLFQKCIREINTLNRKDLYGYIAMEGFEDRSDQLIISKLVNLMRNTFSEVDVYICWPPHLKHLAPREVEYS